MVRSSTTVENCPADKIALLKRQFFELERYHTVDSLVEATATSALTAWYVQVFLRLRRKHQHRHTLEELRARDGRWQETFVKALWNVYVTEYNLFNRGTAELQDAKGLERLTRKERRHLQGTSLVRAKRIPVTVTAQKNLTLLEDLCKQRRVVMWLDNYNKLRFAHAQIPGNFPEKRKCVVHCTLRCQH